MNAPGNVALRDDLLIRLVLATYNGGRIDQAGGWADRAIAAGMTGTGLPAAHRMAGIARYDAGALVEADAHLRRAYELAAEAGDARATSDCLASLADLHRVRGDLARAEAACLEAEALCPDRARDAVAVHAVVLRNRGAFPEALARMEHAARIGPLRGETLERRMQAVFRSWTSLYKAELGRLDEATADLDGREVRTRREVETGSSRGNRGTKGTGDDRRSQGGWPRRPSAPCPLPPALAVSRTPLTRRGRSCRSWRSRCRRRSW